MKRPLLENILERRPSDPNWQLVHELVRQDSFRVGHTCLPCITSNESSGLDEWSLPSIVGDYFRPTGPRPYLPIELFKLHRGYLVKKPWTRTFLSSGTTQATRSISPFSFNGLDLYRTGALLAFHDLCVDLFERVNEVKIVSLIPPLQIWPDSSLAQMITWIADIWPVHWVDDVRRLREVVSQMDLNSPIILFGTAFHWVHWLDLGESLSLTSQNFVIETGGTKGKSRQITRDELYSSLSRQFHITPNQIISEYGMCEMASQAYDWVSPKIQAIQPLKERWFQFPSWVQTKVVTSLNETPAEKGEGLLVVNDPLRIDFKLPLRTQDLVVLKKNGSFQIKGRAPYTPLKGCSLGAEELLDQKTLILPQNVPSRLAEQQPKNFYSIPNSNFILSRVQVLIPLLQNLFSSKNFADLLFQEFKHPEIAEMALEDLRVSLPQTSGDWVTAAYGAIEEKIKTTVPATNWLFILPSTHSLAGFYPVALAYLLGFKVSVRLPWIEKRSIDEFLHLLKITDPTAAIEVLSPNFKIGSSPLPSEIEAILIYGEDLTIRSIREMTGLPVQGFGTTISLNLIHCSEINNAQDALRDCLAIGQQGCLSSRAIYVWSESEIPKSQREDWESQLSQASIQLLKGPLSLVLSCPIEAAWIEQNLHHETKSSIPFDPTKPLVIPFESSQTVDPLAPLQEKPMVVPIIFIERSTPEKILKEFHKNTAQWNFGISEKTRKRLEGQAPGSSLNTFEAVSFAHLGQLNRPAWDGRHQGVALFVTS